VRCRRGLLVVLFFYLALDLSVPVVGGAFVFEASETIKSLQVSRTRTAGVFVVTPRLPDVGPAPPARMRCRGALVAPTEEPPVGLRVGHHRPRSALAPAVSSDDH
jgi:hypothetical protein